MLLVVSGLMIKNVVAVSQIDYPYATKDVFIGTVIAGQAKYPKDEDVLALQDRLLERMAAQPGVRSVAFGDEHPGARRRVAHFRARPDVQVRHGLPAGPPPRGLARIF